MAGDDLSLAPLDLGLLPCEVDGPRGCLSLSACCRGFFGEDRALLGVADFDFWGLFVFLVAGDLGTVVDFLGVVP